MIQRKKNHMKIFVQIASYRDPELINTLKSMIETAKKPKNLRIGICRQYHPDDLFDNLDEYKIIDNYCFTFKFVC